MKYAIYILITLFSFQLLQSQVLISNKPSWVINEHLNQLEKTPESVSGGIQILLYTEQVHIDLEETFVKNASKVMSFNGIQNISTVSADYDPTYQKLRFHNISITRNGTTINKLKQEDIQTARRETNATNFINDGTISAFVNITDVRLGDIVTFSYSLKGFNPIHKNKYASSFILNSDQAVNRLSVHILSKNSINYKLYKSKLVVKKSKKNGIHHYNWSQDNVAAILFEEQSPSWFFQYAMLVVTQYNSWTEVINWGDAIYSFNEANSEQLTAIMDILMMLTPHSSDIDPSVDFGLKKICYDKITVFF